MATHARQQYFADESSLSKERREFSIADEIQEKIDSVEEWAQVNRIDTIKVNWTALVPDANKAVNINVPDVIDNLYTVDSNNALSAKQWKILYDYIQNLLTIGRFLSNWDSATWLPITNPSESPYIYKAWDYYRVSNVAVSPATNYKPDGSSFIIWQASTTVETLAVAVSDLYLYDGTTWILLSNSWSGIAVDSSLSTTSTNPVENRVITNAINNKQNTLTAWSHIDITNDTISTTWLQEELTAWNNIQINNNVINFTNDTWYITSADLKTVGWENLVWSWDIKAVINTATWTDSLTVFGNPSSVANNINIWATSTSSSGWYSVAIWNYARATWTSSVALWRWAWAWWVSSVAIGRDSSAWQENSIAIGRSAIASWTNSIQIWKGSTTATKKLNVWFDTDNYELLDWATGLIPDARISTNIQRTANMVTTLSWADNTHYPTTKAVSDAIEWIWWPDIDVEDKTLVITEGWWWWGGGWWVEDVLVDWVSVVTNDVANINLSWKQDVSNLVTSVSSSSTDSQYPSAKLFYDTCWDIETLINAL